MATFKYAKHGESQTTVILNVQKLEIARESDEESPLVVVLTMNDNTTQQVDRIENLDWWRLVSDE